MAHKHPTLTVYFVVFGLLLGMTGVTVAVAYADLGAWSWVAAVGIAAFKATVVILYFMHVRYSSPLIALYAASGFLFFLIFVAITLGETVGRPAATRDPLAPTQVPSAFPR